MRVAVIGAGAAGLVSARQAVEAGCFLDVFEQTNLVGGTWNYEENPPDNCHSSMYKNLRTNLPKEMMIFDGLDYETTEASYFSFWTVLDYLNKYADKFDLKKHIKFETKVLKVSRILDKWKITWQNLSTHTQHESFYDAVFVCNGHYSVPMFPKYKGISKFKGRLVHSHLYRVPEEFEGETVLMIGMGPSGQDIVFDLCTAAKKVFMSHHFDAYLKNTFPPNSEHRPDVAHFNEDSVVFIDGSSVHVDSVLFCTGYEYSFSFLDKSCGIKIEDNYVSPLYKHMININHPTMVFIGIPYRTIIFPMFEIQAKCFLNILKKNAELPSKKEMEADMKEWEWKMSQQGLPKKRYHMIMDYVRTYLGDIARIGKVDPIPEVIFMLFERTSRRRFESLPTYRDEVFTVINPQSYTVRMIKNP